MSTNRRPGLARSLPSSGITMQLGRVQITGPSLQDIHQAVQEFSGQNWTQGTQGTGTTTTTASAGGGTGGTNRPKANISPAARERMRQGAARARAALARKRKTAMKTMTAGG